VAAPHHAEALRARERAESGADLDVPRERAVRRRVERRDAVCERHPRGISRELLDEREQPVRVAGASIDAADVHPCVSLCARR
jgi:hypothetical protein